MEIRLGTIEASTTGQKITFLNEIDEITFNVLKESLSRIENYNSIKNLNKIFIINFLELSNYLQLAVDNLSSNQKFLLQNNREPIENIYLQSNRLFLNFLSSFRTLIDHIETYLKRKYGNSSKEFNQFKIKTNSHFDSTFEYRFFCKLRNYGQHCGLPISKIQYSIRKSESNDKKFEVLLNPMFNKTELLTKFQEWGKVKNDLLDREEEFPVMWTVKFFFQCIQQLFEEIDNIELSDMSFAIDQIDSVCKHLYPENENIEVCIFYGFERTTPNSMEKSTFKTLTIPTKLFAEIRKQY